jgi:hypothetical protein
MMITKWLLPTILYPFETTLGNIPHYVTTCNTQTIYSSGPRTGSTLSNCMWHHVHDWGQFDVSWRHRLSEGSWEEHCSSEKKPTPWRRRAMLEESLHCPPLPSHSTPCPNPWGFLTVNMQHSTPFNNHINWNVLLISFINSFDGNKVAGYSCTHVCERFKFSEWVWDTLLISIKAQIQNNLNDNILGNL